jgi:hypothetical protein
VTAIAEAPMNKAQAANRIKAKAMQFLSQA